MCQSCNATMINGVYCHETGCPDSWRDSETDCVECGGGFIRLDSTQRVCDPCLEGFEETVGECDDYQYD